MSKTIVDLENRKIEKNDCGRIKQMIKHGPIDVIVLASGEPRLDGRVFAELKRQAAAGTIRVLDAMLLMKDDSGKGWRFDLEDLPPEEAAKVGFIETGTLGLFDSADAETLIEGMVPGSVVVALAIEHVWAVALVNAMYDAGAELAMNFRV
ncbi:MAG: DUF6325 family protein, partial [Methanotrichaceae archaeon]|nr:DUF6325 family protein [Methanotrichaceae archaeon]